MHPLVIAGGPTVYSSEPVADFIDVFVIGDGEEAFPELVSRYIELRDSDMDLTREQILKEIARIEGMYVPSLYPTSVSPHHGLLIVDQARRPRYPVSDSPPRGRGHQSSIPFRRTRPCRRSKRCTTAWRSRSRAAASTDAGSARRARSIARSASATRSRSWTRSSTASRKAATTRRV